MGGGLEKHNSREVAINGKLVNAEGKATTLLFVQEPVNLRLKLAVLNFSRILRLTGVTA